LAFVVNRTVCLILKTIKLPVIHRLQVFGDVFQDQIAPPNRRASGISIREFARFWLQGKRLTAISLQTVLPCVFFSRQINERQNSPNGDRLRPSGYPISTSNILM